MRKWREQRIRALGERSVLTVVMFFVEETAGFMKMNTWAFGSRHPLVWGDGAPSLSAALAAIAVVKQGSVSGQSGPTTFRS